MRSNGQDFQHAREARPLPGESVRTNPDHQKLEISSQKTLRMPLL
jgi:hypothetical protein